MLLISYNTKINKILLSEFILHDKRGISEACVKNFQVFNFFSSKKHVDYTFCIII